jgi:hypothetical protein
MWNIYFSTDIDVFVSLCDMLMWCIALGVLLLFKKS